MGLKEYHRKRDFNSTNEPKGKVKKSETRKFVIQYHEARAKHYDFRLEHNGVLLSWAVPKGLSTNPKYKRLAVHVEDHPLDYIDFEGIIPKGNYGAGTVEIFDCGKYVPLEDVEKGLKKGHIKIYLYGNKLTGGWSLIKFKEDNWFIVKLEDEFAGIEKKKNTKLPFKETSVQLATLTEKIPTGKDWIFEIKYDGYRIVSYVENGKVKMFSRNNVDYTKKFKSLTQSLKKIDQDSFVVDGEVVSFDENGRPDFSLLQESIKKESKNLFYCVFDLLALNGEDLRNLPLIERKAKLERLLFKAEDNLIFSTHVENGKETFTFAKKNNLEGIVAKKKDSIYTCKRTEDWLKIKCYMRQEFVVVGYTTTTKNKLLSALLLGYYEKGQLTYVGKVGTGFSDEDRIKLNKKFQKYIVKTSPLKKEINNLKNVTWLKPKFVAEIQFAELTKENFLRQPSFMGLRSDKNVKDVILEVKSERD